MKKLIILALFAVSMVTLISCDNWTSRKWGGSTTITLPKGEKLGVLEGTVTFVELR